jgi:excisionase family DNA binding protein
LRRVPPAPAEAHPPTVAPSSSEVEPLGWLKTTIVEDLAARLAPLVQDRAQEREHTDTFPADGWLTVDDVARLARTCRRTVYRALHSGALVGEKVGPLWRIRPAALAEWAKPVGPRPCPPAMRSAAGPSRATRRGGGAPTRDVTPFKTRARAGRARKE